MGGRLTRITPLADIIQAFAIAANACDLGPSDTIAPTPPIAVIQEANGVRRLVPLRWGLIPAWAKEPSIGHRMINARAETLSQQPSFRRAFKPRRCLSVADGLFEWQHRGAGKVPLSIRLRSGRPLAFAGLYDDWTSPEGQSIGTCAIITTDANDLMRPIHHRMPVILPTAHHAVWLDPTIDDEALPRPLLQPCPSEAMEADEVSRLVNAPRHHAPTYIATVPLG
jgi:putative SOS response-associated peptidase YedK